MHFADSRVNNAEPMPHKEVSSTASQNGTPAMAKGSSNADSAGGLPTLSYAF